MDFAMISRILIYLCLAVGAALHAQELPEEWDVTIDVNQLDPTADDKDATTPFKTISAAAQNAMGFARAGRNVLVRIHPGVYREDVGLTGKPDESEGWIKFEGTDPGKVIINGSNIVNGWRVNDDNQFELPWKAPGGADNPTIFIEGARMIEVHARDRVGIGKVYFGKDTIYLIPPKGAVITNGKVEIGRGGTGISAGNLGRVFIENLAFERGFSSAISIGYDEGRQGSAVVINNVSVEYSQSNGVTITNVDFARLRRLIVERCGLSGIWISQVNRVAVTGSEANLNGWSTIPSKGFREGVSLLNCGEIKVWSLRVVENHYVGMAVRSNREKASLGKLTIVKNGGAGLSCSEGAGQTIISESEIAYNGRSGAILGQNVFCIASMFYGNGGPQLALTASCGYSRNILVATDGQGLVEVGADVKFKAEQNLFDASGKAAFKLGGKQLTFAQWQEQTQQDLNSFFGDPKLLNPANYQFTPTPGSPWFNMKNWPVRELN